jgi:hypothetical protein
MESSIPCWGIWRNGEKKFSKGKTFFGHKKNWVGRVTRPLNCMETFTPCSFLAYFGDVFFSLFSIIWGHSVAASLGFQALIYVI